MCSYFRAIRGNLDSGWAEGTHPVASFRPSIDLIYPSKEYAERDWAIIRAFGYHDVYNELGAPGSNPHRLENLMTFKYMFNHHFDRLELWFEPTVTYPDFCFPTLINGPLPGYSQFVRSMFKHSRPPPPGDGHSQARRVYDCTGRPPTSITEISEDPRNLLSRCAHVWRSGLLPQRG